MVTWCRNTETSIGTCNDTHKGLGECSSGIGECVDVVIEHGDLVRDGRDVGRYLCKVAFVDRSSNTRDSKGRKEKELSGEVDHREYLEVIGGLSSECREGQCKCKVKKRIADRLLCAVPISPHPQVSISRFMT